MLKHFLKVTAICTLILASLYAGIFAVNILSFPSEIRLTEDTQHRLVFGVPISANIRADNLHGLKVNHSTLSSVEETATVYLHDPLWLEANGSGTATMTLTAFGVPLRDVTLDVLPTLELVPCGVTVGVRINTHGVMVLGTGTVKDANGRILNPSEGRLRAGDLILSANGVELSCKEDLIEVIAKNDGDLQLRIRRGDENINTSITPVKGLNGNMIGSWVRDSTQGIGTITYFNPATNTFGALGHGIMDVDTKQLMTVKSGHIIPARISSVKKGVRGTPGELVGIVERQNILGQITTNSPYGIFGVMERAPVDFPPLRVAKQDQIEEGPALIRTNVSGTEVRDFEIEIENVNRFSTDNTKGMVIRITDPELLDITGGIVQGMSGSPIIQNDKLVGAVTHVFVQDPTKGYGIFIENMLRQERQGREAAAR